MLKNKLHQSELSNFRTLAKFVQKERRMIRPIATHTSEANSATTLMSSNQIHGRLSTWAILRNLSRR